MISDSFCRSVEVCKCGHGTPHHNELGCSCDVGYYKDEKICDCRKFRLDWYIDKKLGKVFVNDN